MNQMSNEYTAALLAGFDILSESLKVGERMWIDDNIYWIRLYEPEAGPFKIKFYKVDTCTPSRRSSKDKFCFSSTSTAGNSPKPHMSIGPLEKV